MVSVFLSGITNAGNIQFHMLFLDGVFVDSAELSAACTKQDVVAVFPCISVMDFSLHTPH